MSSKLSKRRARAQPTPLVPPKGLWINVRRAITRVRMMEKRVLNSRDVATAIDSVMHGTAKASTGNPTLTSRQWEEVVKIVKELGLDEEEAVARVVHHFPEFQFGETEGIVSDKDFRGRVVFHQKRRGRMAKKAKDKAERERRRATVNPPSTDTGASVDASSQLPQMAENETTTNDEPDTKVSAFPPSSSIAKTTSAPALQERAAPPLVAPVPRSERAQLGQRAHRPRGSTPLRRPLINPDHLEFLVRNLSVVFAEGRRRLGFREADFQEAMPSNQLAADVAQTLQQNEKHGEVIHPGASSGDASIGESAQQSTGTAKVAKIETTACNAEHPPRTSQTGTDRNSAAMGRMLETERCDAMKAGALEQASKAREAKRAASGFGADWSNLADAFNKAADANEATDARCGLRAVHSKRTRADNDENGEKFVKRPRFSGRGRTSGEHEFLTPFVDAMDPAAMYAEASASSRQTTSSVTVRKLGEDDGRYSDTGASQPNLDRIKGEYVEESGIKVEPSSDEALMYDDGSDESSSTSIATSSPLRLPIWLQDRIEKVEGDLDDAGLLVGAARLGCINSVLQTTRGTHQFQF